MNINGDSRVADGGRKLWKRPADPYLRKYLADIRIQTEIEIKKRRPPPHSAARIVRRGPGIVPDCLCYSNSTRRQDLSGLKRVNWRASAAVFIPRSFP
jgi:hypothetical protein